MTEQITWTHVDKLVRRMHDERGMLQSGMNDAEVTYTMIKFLDRQTRSLSESDERNERRCHELEIELMKLRNAPKSKTKQRLATLECQVARLIELAKQV